MVLPGWQRAGEPTTDQMLEKVRLNADQISYSGSNDTTQVSTGCCMVKSLHCCSSLSGGLDVNESSIGLPDSSVESCAHLSRIVNESGDTRVHRDWYGRETPARLALPDEPKHRLSFLLRWELLQQLGDGFVDSLQGLLLIFDIKLFSDRAGPNHFVGDTIDEGEHQCSFRDIWSHQV